MLYMWERMDSRSLKEDNPDAEHEHQDSNHKRDQQPQPDGTKPWDQRDCAQHRQSTHNRYAYRVWSQWRSEAIHISETLVEAAALKSYDRRREVADCNGKRHRPEEIQTVETDMTLFCDLIHDSLSPPRWR